MRTPEEIGGDLTIVVAGINAISIEECDSLIRGISRDEALGPMLDPTKWRDENMFDTSHKTRIVLEAIKVFKNEVSSIGYFNKICQHEWVSAVNEVVKSGQVCTKCQAIRA